MHATCATRTGQAAEAGHLQHRRQRGQAYPCCLPALRGERCCAYSHCFSGDLSPGGGADDIEEQSSSAKDTPWKAAGRQAAHILMPRAGAAVD